MFAHYREYYPGGSYSWFNFRTYLYLLDQCCCHNTLCIAIGSHGRYLLHQGYHSGWRLYHPTGSCYGKSQACGQCHFWCSVDLCWKQQCCLFSYYRQQCHGHLCLVVRRNECLPKFNEWQEHYHRFCSQCHQRHLNRYRDDHGHRLFNDQYEGYYGYGQSDSPCLNGQYDLYKSGRQWDDHLEHLGQRGKLSVV